MHQVIILQGGEDVKKRKNYEVLEGVTRISKHKRILVIPWTTTNKKKEITYRKILENYFKDIGFREVLFLEKNDGKKTIEKKIKIVDVIYLPGGDPTILYREIKKRRLEKKLKNFKGILIGNSAGAIVLSKGEVENKRLTPGLGIVDFYVKVHFDLKDIFKNFYKEKIIVCLPESSWIAIKKIK
jgi:dipeptidase E